MAESTQSTQKPGMAARLKAAAGRMLAKLDYRLHVAAANVWRDSYNPLRGLTMARAVSLLEEGERGAYADLQWTYRFIEMQDAVLPALIECRSSALEEMDWDIRVSDRAQTPEQIALADKQAERLKEVYEGIGNLQEAIEFLALASFRGYSHLEIVRNADGDITELAKVEQWHWVRDGLAGGWEYNPQSTLGVNRGDDVPLERFIIREVPRPINRVALVAFLRKNLSQKDWDGFVETYGIPAIFVVMPPELGESQRDEFQSVAEDIIADARGVLPGNSDIKTIDNGARGANPFRDHIKYQDEQMVLRGTGGKLTMLTESGSGTLAGGAHTETFKRIAAAEAKKISELLRKHIDAAVLDAEFAGKPVYAGFEIASNEETDTGEIVKDAATLANAGYEVEDAWLEEKTGYKLKDKGRGMKDEGGVLKPEIMNREATAGTAVVQDERNLLSAAAEMLAVARVTDTSDLAGELRMILGIEDEQEMTTALQEWRDALPDAVGKTAAMDAAWERVLAGAFASGFGDGPGDGIKNSGNSDGSRKGWETRRKNGWTPSQRPKGSGKPKKGRKLSTVEAVLDAAYEDPDNRDFVEYQKVDADAAAAIEKRAGPTPAAVGSLVGYGRTVEAEKAMKILGKHTTDKYPVTEEDFRRLPDYLDAPDKQRWVMKEGDTPRLESTIKVGRDMFVVEEAQTGNKRLTILSMYRP